MIDAPANGRPDVRRLVATAYSRQQIASAICESFVEAFHVRGDLTPAEREWLRTWLGRAVPRLTEQTLDALAAQLGAALGSAPANLLGSLDERRRRASFGVE
ncbi:MAG TPA: hypothetical protein VFI28_06970 [Candidatus Limnocylindrales bacterium]|nr:hypothetical protein [Candidatus Limnocylindrales bacterium]